MATAYTAGDDLNCFELNRKFESGVYKLYSKGISYDTTLFNAAVDFQGCLTADPKYAKYQSKMTEYIGKVDGEMAGLNLQI